LAKAIPAVTITGEVATVGVPSVTPGSLAGIDFKKHSFREALNRA
jgi:hypothetical protein